MSVIDPAANHMEEVHSDCEVQALFPPTDEEPQTEGAAGQMTAKLRYRPCSLMFHFCVNIKMPLQSCKCSRFSKYQIQRKYPFYLYVNKYILSFNCAVVNTSFMLFNQEMLEQQHFRSYSSHLWLTKKEIKR